MVMEKRSPARFSAGSSAWQKVSTSSQPALMKGFEVPQQARAEDQTIGGAIGRDGFVQAHAVAIGGDEAGRIALADQQGAVFVGRGVARHSRGTGMGSTSGWRPADRQPARA